METAIFRINYKSDFILTLESDAGWMTPFCIKFWTGAPSQAYFAGFDGETYTHCAPVEGEPTKLVVQFDDHHLPIGDLKFQIGYHFTVADFPTSVEDEVLNQASVIIEVNDAPAQVMLDLNGETAPEIEFSLPAYANEAQRIANEEERIEAEQQRIANEESRIQAETIRQQNEQQRINQETARVNEFATLKSQSQAATRNANDAATLANQKAQLAADKAALADDAATLAIQKAQLAADKAALANDAAQLAADKAALAQQKAEYAQQQGSYAKDQGDYAKDQGDYAKAQGDIAQSDHERAETDHGIAADDHTQAGNDHTRAEADHGIAANDHTQAGNDHTRAESDHGIAANDHTQAGNDHTRAESDHGIAADDHTQAGNDHTRAESDHTRAESDHAAVEVYVDSLGAFDISAYHATGGVLAKYADLTAALGTNGANIPEALRKGGMSVKFVLSSDNKYVQYRLMAQTFTTNATQWQSLNSDDKPTIGSDNLVKSGGVTAAIDENANQIGQLSIVASKYGRVAHATKQVTEATGTRSKTDFYDVSDFVGKTIFFQSPHYGDGFSIGIFLKSLDSWTNGVSPDYTATDYEFVYYGERTKKVVPADAKYFGLIDYHTYEVVIEHNNLVLSEDGFLRTLMKGIDTSNNPRIATIVVPSSGSRFSYNIKTSVFTFPATTAIKWKNADVDILGETKTITLSHNYGIVVYDTQTKAITDRYNTALQANEYVLFGYNKVFIDYFAPLITTLPIDAIEFQDNGEALFRQIDIGKITALIASAKYAFEDNVAMPLQLLWFSDIHGATDRLEAIKHIRSYFASMFDDVLSSGDQISQYFTDSFDWWSAGGAGNFLQVIGNHEVWKGGSDYATVSEVYQKYFAPFISNWNVVSPGANLCYYYKDYASSNIRLIVLDCMNWDDAQKNWLIATLASAKTANLNVLIAQHYMAGTPTPIECDYTAINVVQEGTISSEAPQAVQDFINGGGSFICWIGGHYHADYIYALANYPGQYGILIGTASASQREKNNYRGRPLFYNLFSAFQVDITYHQVKLVRFGANIDRWMRHKELVCFDYTNGNVRVF